MVSLIGSLTWNTDKPVDKDPSKPASKRAREAAPIASVGVATGPATNSAAPGGKPPRRGPIWGKRLVAAGVVAAATGLGTGLAGKGYEEGKAWFFALFASHGWTAYTLEPNPSCDKFSFAESEKAFGDVGLNEYSWNVIRVSHSWSGSATKRSNGDVVYNLNGIDQGTYAVVTYSSRIGLDGIGSYVLSQRTGEGKGLDFYVGHWIGRECSIQGHPLIKCPMVVVPTSVQESKARTLLPSGRCQLAEPSLPHR
jgi:hypothetical protein